MKLIALGDTHGRTDWKPITAREKYDKVVFVGDYFDSHEQISPHQQIENFEEIVAFKKDNPEQVVLLFGNHDYHYLPDVRERYSGYQPALKASVQPLLTSAIDEGLLQMCFVWENLLFSHAGVTKTWCQRNHIPLESMVESINHLLRHRPASFAFTPGVNDDPTGDDVEQSPIWVRPASLRKDLMGDFIQVVGHTVQKNLKVNEPLILIDVLVTSGEYLIWEDFQLRPGSRFSLPESTIT